MERIWILVSTRSQTRGCIDHDLITGRRGPVGTPFTRDTGKGQANTLSELSVTDQAINMSGSGLLQYIALDRMDVVFATKEVRSRTTKADVLALLLLKRVAW